MYNQKSLEKTSAYFKLFIIVSMLFVCLFSLKLRVNAEEDKYDNAYHITIYNYLNLSPSYGNKITVGSVNTSRRICFLQYGSVNEYTDNDNYVSVPGYILLTEGDSQCPNFKGSVTYMNKDNSAVKYKDDYSSFVASSYSVYRDDFSVCSKVSGYSIETDIPIFDNIADARSYIETGKVEQEELIYPIFDDNDKYVSSYSLKGFNATKDISATWTGCTKPMTFKPITDLKQKVLISALYYDYDKSVYIDTVDVDKKKWECPIEVLQKKEDEYGKLCFVKFTPYFYDTSGQVYYGDTVQLNVQQLIEIGDQTVPIGYDTDENGNKYINRGVNFNYNTPNTLGYLQGVKRQLVSEPSTGYQGIQISWNSDDSSLYDCRVEVALRFVQSKISDGSSLYQTVPYLDYDNAPLYQNGTVRLDSDMKLLSFFKEKYQFDDYGYGCSLDKIFVRLIRYDGLDGSGNKIFSYGGWVTVDPHTINTEGINTSIVDNYGKGDIDSSSSDSYSDTSGGIFGNGEIFTKDSAVGSLTNIVNSLNNVQRFLGDGSFDAFLRASFSFIPGEIWTVILSGLSIIVALLLIKVILRVF